MTERRTELLVVGVSHRSATAELREDLFLDDAAHAAVLLRLRTTAVRQAMVLSTCHRTEVYAAAPNPADLARRVFECLAERAGIGVDDLIDQGYAYAGKAALRHLFAVAAGLDSVVVGEPQILGQVRDSHRLASGAAMIGPDLDAALRAAYATAKRVRSETTVAERPSSIAAVVARLAHNVHGDLAGCRAVLLGGGEMGELIAQQLRQSGLVRITVLHPSVERASVIARRLGAHVRPFAELSAGLAEADVVIGALGRDSPVVRAADLRAALLARRRRPMVCIDSAVPGDIDPAADRLDDAFLFGLGDLERIALEGRASRAASAEAAWAIVDEEAAAFQAATAARNASPAIVALRSQFEAMRVEVLREAPKADAATATRMLINRLLHGPSVRLRAVAAEAAADGGDDVAAMEHLLARLFGTAGLEDEALADRSSTATGDGP